MQARALSTDATAWRRYDTNEVVRSRLPRGHYRPPPRARALWRRIAFFSSCALLLLPPSLRPTAHMCTHLHIQVTRPSSTAHPSSAEVLPSPVAGVHVRASGGERQAPNHTQTSREPHGLLWSSPLPCFRAPVLCSGGPRIQLATLRTCLRCRLWKKGEGARGRVPFYVRFRVGYAETAAPTTDPPPFHTHTHTWIL